MATINKTLSLFMPMKATFRSCQVTAPATSASPPLILPAIFQITPPLVILIAMENKISPSQFFGDDDILLLSQDCNACTLCHKHSTTLSLPCNSTEYQRHLDHGDAIGACPGGPDKPR